MRQQGSALRKTYSLTLETNRSANLICPPGIGRKEIISPSEILKIGWEACIAQQTIYNVPWHSNKAFQPRYNRAGDLKTCQDMIVSHTIDNLPMGPEQSKRLRRDNATEWRGHLTIAYQHFAKKLPFPKTNLDGDGKQDYTRTNVVPCLTCPDDTY